MTLTYGSAPFGPRPSGVFNFEREGPEHVLYWEDFPKRVRVELEGTTIADSRRMKALHETGHLMVLYFPREDLETSLLEATDHRSECPFKGTASYWSVRVGERVVENAVWAYEDPLPSAPPIGSHVAFFQGKMDAWYEEDEKVYGHPRDPYHRVDVHRSSRRVVVRHAGEVVAESETPQILFETGLPPRHYLPPGDVRTELLERSEHVSHCPYKGAGQHWHLDVGGERIDDAAWSLPRPIGEARERLEGWYCFYPGKVETEVDGEALEG